ALLGVGAVALGVHAALRRSVQRGAAAAGLALGAGLVALLGPTHIVSPHGLFVWIARFGEVPEVQPTMRMALGIFVGLFVLGLVPTAIVASRQRAEKLKPSGSFGTATFGDGSWFAPSKGGKGHGIPVGYKEDGPSLLYDDTGAHTFVCAPTGAGKTVGFAVPTLLSHRGSTVVLDVKGELFAVTARHRREGLGQRVRRIDPFGAAGPLPADSFNPMDTVVTAFDLAHGTPTALDREEAPFAFDNAKMISEMLVAKSGEEKEPFFVDNARQFLTGLILFVAAEHRRMREAQVPDFEALRRLRAEAEAAGARALPDFEALYALDAAVRATGGDAEAAADHGEALPLFPGMPTKTVRVPNKKRTLIEVRRLLMAPDGELRALLDAMTSHAHPVVKKRGAQFARMDERTFSSVVATVRSHTEFLDSPSIQAALEQSTFDFRDLKDDPTSVFLVMPVERLDNYSRYVRVMIGCAQARLLAVRYKPKDPVLFLLDEFPRLQRFDKIDEGLSAHRGFGIQYLIIVQSVAQLEEAYGPLWRNFITNTTLQILWSPNDDQACKFISDAAGDQTVAYVEVSDNTGSQGRHVIADSYSAGSSRTVRETRRKLIEPDEARTLDRAFCFVFSRGRAPVILRRPNYLTDPVFRGNFDPNPYHGDGEKEVLVSDAGAALVAASKAAYADPASARRALLKTCVEGGPTALSEAVRSKPQQFGKLVRRASSRKAAPPREAAVRAAARAAQFMQAEGEERVREMLAMPPAPDGRQARAAFEEASEMLFAYPAAARAQFAARCQSDGPAAAARALCADPSWAGPEAHGLDAAERSRLARDFARAGARVSTLRGLAAVGDEFA
ncbi:MAG: type IV secretory system conjugative DNA transfer family protein, partial [Bacteroidota bacterium]